MVQYTSTGKPRLHDLDERFRRIAFRIGSVGLGLVASAFLLSAATGVLRASSYFEALTYGVILTAIALSARRDFHVRTMLHDRRPPIACRHWDQ